MEVTRRFAKYYPMITNEPEVQQLRKDILSYQSILDNLRISDAQIKEKPSFVKNVVTVLDRLLFLLILLPLSLPGWFLNTPIIFLGKLFNSLTPYQESKATHTLAAMFLFVPVVYIFVAFMLKLIFGVTFSLSLILLPAVGVVRRNQNQIYCKRHFAILQDQNQQPN